MIPASIPLESIARMAHEGRVFRSFGRFLAAQNGSLLAVPVGLVTGDFSQVRDGCPVSWQEVFTAVDTPISGFSKVLMPEVLAAEAGLIAALFPPYGWVQDVIAVSAGGRPVHRVCSPDGVVFCWIPRNNDN